MKPVLFIFILCLTVTFVVVYSIHWYVKGTDAVPPLEGSYIRFSQHEFGKEWDTVIIKQQASPVNRFLLTRRWKYERVLDGNTLPPEYKLSTTAARFLEKEKLLVEEETGIRYSYDENKKQMLAGTTVYQKIK